VGILGATRGPWGTRLAQAALRQTLTACNALTLPTPQVYVRGAAELFDASGRLIDEHTAAALARYLAALVQWTAAARALRASRRPV